MSHHGPRPTRPNGCGRHFALTYALLCDVPSSPFSSFTKTLPAEKKKPFMELMKKLRGVRNATTGSKEDKKKQATQLDLDIHKTLGTEYKRYRSVQVRVLLLPCAGAPRRRGRGGSGDVGLNTYMHHTPRGGGCVCGQALCSEARETCHGASQAAAKQEHAAKKGITLPTKKPPPPPPETSASTAAAGSKKKKSKSGGSMGIGGSTGKLPGSSSKLPGSSKSGKTGAGKKKASTTMGAAPVG